MKTSHIGHSYKSGARGKIFPEINRAEVARQLGLTPGHISKILSGSVHPSTDVLERLAKLLGIRMEDLLRRVRQENHIQTN